MSLSVKSLVEKRKEAFADLSALYNEFKHFSASDLAKAKAKILRVERISAAFQQLQAKLEVYNESCTDKKDMVLVKKEQSSFDSVLDKVYEVLYMLQDQQAAASAPSTSTTPAVRRSVPLPPIALPHFQGEEWTGFFNIFKSLVHNNQGLNEDEKFHYLLSCLDTPDSKACVAQFPVNGTHYQAAVDALKARYESKRKVASQLMQEMLSFERLSRATAEGLSALLSVHRNCISALKALNIPDLVDFVLFYLTYSKVDKETRYAFDSKQPDLSAVPNSEELLNFIQQRMQVEDLHNTLSGQTKSSTRVKPAARAMTTLLEAVPSYPDACPVVHTCPACHQQHNLQSCPVFGNKSVADRYTLLKDLQRCFACLGPHPRSRCQSKFSCRLCSSKEHHSLLHSWENVRSDTPQVQEPAQPNKRTPAPRPAKQKLQQQSLACHSVLPTQVLLMTAKVGVQDATHKLQSMRAVVDSCSQQSFITEAAVQRLGLKRRHDNTSVSGVSEIKTHSRGRVDLVIHSRIENSCSYPVSALILPDICGALPDTPLAAEVIDKFKDIPLADPGFAYPASIDLLLSASLYSQVLVADVPNFLPGRPAAQKTTLGWLILGESSLSTASATALFTVGSSLEESVARFWALEEVTQKAVSNPEDEAAEKHFCETHSRDPTGRYMVALPFKENISPLRENKFSAVRSYLNLEGRLKKNSAMQAAYQAHLQEYVLRGYMEPAATPALYVLSHHVVQKGSKYRVVYNASTEDVKGRSLNDCLLAGPPLQRDLSHILTQFRFNPVALSADIKAMFLQVLMRPEDRRYTHIITRPSPEAPLVEYTLNSVIFGVTSSPFHAMRVLQQLVYDEGHNYPRASAAILNSTYVDNIVCGAQTRREAARLKTELIQLLEKGKFELRKWACNEEQVIADLAPEYHDVVDFSLHEPSLRILGLLWSHESDSFAYHVQAFTGPVTKRNILSYTARIFDPLGFFCPAVFWIKSFLQLLWKASLDWDEPLSSALQLEWCNFARELPRLTEARIPRFVNTQATNIRVVGFCDASTTGYAAALYLRSSVQGRTKVQLIKARSRVAPLKPTTVPRLELCAALLLSELFDSMKSVLVFPHSEDPIFFTDSSIVLSWLSIAPHRLKTFVANRVVSVLEKTKLGSWCHVDTQHNAADCASRGLSPLELLQDKLWWKGPSFLTLPEEEWPSNNPCVYDPLLEMKAADCPVLINIEQEANPFLSWISQFSTLHRLKRVLAFVLRFAHNSRAQHTGQPALQGPLQVKELECALISIVRIVQEEEYAAIVRGDTCPKPLRSLTPFVDPVGCVRVGGRLSQAPLPAHSRHPLLLPAKSLLARLLIKETHLTTLHGGPLLMLATIRTKWWIPNIMPTLRSCVFRCNRCYRFKAKITPPVMADLPASRFSAVRAFLHTGVDFAGPFTLKESARRKAPTYKAYVSVFVCFSTKACHLELVTSLTTAAFLAAVDRFVARRGLCETLHSDRGTNFVGAARELREVRDFLLKSSELEQQLASKQISFKFNPPASPHMGGLWESAVKGMKHHLVRVVGLQVLTYEEFSTLLTRIEAVMNSRPLCALPSDPNDDVTVLTPGHFLVGSSLLAVPETSLLDTPTNRLSRWKLLRQCLQSFWAAWRRSYLQSLMQRKRWTSSSPPLQVGQLVLLKDDSVPPLVWPIARVVEIYPDKHGEVRVVKIKTSGDASYVRPAHSLLPMPQDEA